jgi:hypothetical protein
MDAAGNRFFFAGTPITDVTPRLYTVNTTNGSVLSDPNIAAGTSFLGLEYDAAEGTLYALRSPGTASKQLVTVDPSTGVETAVSAFLATSIGMPSGATALDAAGNRFFFVGTQNAEVVPRLFVVDTASGALLASQVIGGPSVTGLEYDADDNILYGLAIGLGSGMQVVTLNPATGAMAAVSASIDPPLGMGSGITGFDTAGDRFFFVATPSSQTDSRLYAVDTNSGAVVTSPTIPGSASQFLQGLAFSPVTAPPPVTTVTIDVMSTVNVRGKGVIPVAILTTPAFDATAVDGSTVQFGPGNASESHGSGHAMDVDGDGDLDLLLHFRTQDAAIPCGATSATLTAPGITGTDSIKTTGC